MGNTVSENVISIVIFKFLNALSKLKHKKNKILASLSNILVTRLV